MQSFRKSILSALLLGLALTLATGIHVAAEEDTAQLQPTITCSNGITAEQINISYYTFAEKNDGAIFMNGDTITLTSETPMDSLYLCWNNKNVSAWTLTLEDGTTQECGQQGYLHEYVKLDHPSKTATIHIAANYTQLVKLCAFKEGELPKWVQIWNDPCDQADILLISTHADDEQLFFGGILPYYGGELGLKVQLAYFCNYWNGAKIREHEKLDGLWEVGIRNYPITGDFDDLDVSNGGLEDAKQRYNFENTKAFMAEIIRRFKPLVVVGQDFAGEYGHGAHQLTARAIADVITLTGDKNYQPASAEKYGTHEVSKAYFHMYAENEILLDVHRPLTNFDNKTVLEVATLGYQKHRSQQWCYFRVSDTTYSEGARKYFHCGQFGLYYTTVGVDTEADLLCHLATYEELARQEEEAASIEASIAESVAESLAESVAESEKASIEASITASKAEAQSIAASIAESEAAEQARIERENKKNTILQVIVVILIAVVLISAILFYVVRRNMRNRRPKSYRK